MDNSGWISLHRKIKSHWVWSNPAYLKAWIQMIIDVNHEEKKVLIEGELIECKRGQSLKSLKSWAYDFGHDWTIQKVRTFFKMLENDNMIKAEGLRKTTRVTICNYDSYQDIQQANNKQKTTKKQPDNKQITTNNNDQQLNNIINNGDFKFDYKNIYAVTWNKWIEFKKSQFKFQYKTKQSEQIALNELAEISNNDPALAEKIVNQSIAKGYKGLFEIKTNGSNGHSVEQKLTHNYKRV